MEKESLDYKPVFGVDIEDREKVIVFKSGDNSLGENPPFVGIFMSIKLGSDQFFYFKDPLNIIRIEDCLSIRRL